MKTGQNLKLTHFFQIKSINPAFLAFKIQCKLLQGESSNNLGLSSHLDIYISSCIQLDEEICTKDSCILCLCQHRDN